MLTVSILVGVGVTESGHDPFKKNSHESDSGCECLLELRGVF